MAAKEEFCTSIKLTAINTVRYIKNTSRTLGAQGYFNYDQPFLQKHDTLKSDTSRFKCWVTRKSNSTAPPGSNSNHTILRLNDFMQGRQALFL